MVLEVLRKHWSNMVKPCRSLDSLDRSPNSCKSNPLSNPWRGLLSAAQPDRCGTRRSPKQVAILGPAGPAQRVTCHAPHLSNERISRSSAVTSSPGPGAPLGSPWCLTTSQSLKDWSQAPDGMRWSTVVGEALEWAHHWDRIIPLSCTRMKLE